MYKELYYSLFNAVTRAMEQLEEQEFSLALLTLEQAQRRCEDIFLSGGGEDGAIP